MENLNHNIDNLNTSLLPIGLMMLLYLFCFSSQAQTLKTYNGSYNGGIAQYEYYEDQNGERVLNGKYTFVAERWDNFYPFQKIEGEYKNNNKTGKWTTIVSNKSKDAFEITKETYMDNVLDGPYSFEKYFIDNAKGGKKVVNSISNFKYKNGVIRTFSIQDIYPYPLKIKGYINENGYADSLWEVKGNILFSNEIDEFGDGKYYNVDVNIRYENNCMSLYSIYDTQKGKFKSKLEKPSIKQVFDTTYFKLDFVDDKSYRSCVNKSISDCKINDAVFKTIAFNLPIEYKTKKAIYSLTNSGRSFVSLAQKNFKNYSSDYIKYFISGDDIEKINSEKHVPSLNKDVISKYKSNVSNAYEGLENLRKYIKIFNSIVNSEEEPLIRLESASKNDKNLDDFLMKNNLDNGEFFNKSADFIENQTLLINTSIEIVKPLATEIFEKREEVLRLKNCRIEVSKLNDDFRINKPSSLQQNEVRVNMSGFFVVNDYLFNHLKKLDLLLDNLNDSTSMDFHPDRLLEIAIKRNSYQDKRKTLISKNKDFTHQVFNFKEASPIRNITLFWSKESLGLKNKKVYKNIFNNFVTPLVESIQSIDNPNEVNDIMDKVLFVLQKCKDHDSKGDNSFLKEINKLKSIEEIYNYCGSK